MFDSPIWLPGGHAQTIIPLIRRGALPDYRRERIDTPDRDFIDLDWLEVPSTQEAPLVVLFHGLEGSSRSHYARSLMRALGDVGWRGVVVHFRGCSGPPNRLLRAYHSGDSDEIEWILSILKRRAPHSPLFAVGVSLGGNALLKYLGEREDQASSTLDAAAAVCPPLDLTLSGEALGRGFNLVYTRHFLTTLRRKALEKAARFPDRLEAETIRRARTLHAFDDAYTAPAHGFHGVADYWQRASSRPWLGGIRVPTLLLVARNDPFVPQAAWPNPSELPPPLVFEAPDAGGHVGFMAGKWPGHIDWLPSRLLDFFKNRIAS